MKHRHLVLMLSITALLFCACRTSQNTRLHSCTSNHMLAETTIEQLQDAAEQRRVQGASIERHPEFSLGVIEFDDEGLSFSREQRQAVTQMIREDSQNRGAILVAFIHGWKHNATVCDSNLTCFRSVLRFLGEREAEGSGRRVIGVYLGWRGLTYCNKVGKQFSFWTRKRIGERLGSNQARRVINDLIFLYNDIKEEHGNTRFVAVGHSLGGGVLFSAVGPLYRQALHDAIEERSGSTLEEIKGFRDVAGRYLYFPDLVVLANPAFEAELYKRTPDDLSAMQKAAVHFSSKQLPLLLSISSRGDTATHIIFPVGQSIKALFSPVMWLRGGSYLHRSIIAAPNYGSYVTDLATVVKPIAGASASNIPRPGNCFTGDLAEVTGGDCGCTELTPLARALEDGNGQGFGAETRRYGNVRLQRSPGVDPYNPFLVVTATRDVLNNHYDIFNPTFMSLIMDLVGDVDEEKGPH